jgi:hypothetical protein
MAANPYIVETDDLTTEQELAIARNTRARILATAQEYELGTPRSRKLEADLRAVNETIRDLQEQLAQEEGAAAGVGGSVNLVEFVRPS